MAEQPFRENPFAAPEAVIDDPAEGVIVVDDRTGPPWEQPGPWAKRFFETMWLCYVNPLRLLRRMRRRGSWWMPVAYYLVAVLLANIALFVLAQTPGGGRQFGFDTSESAADTAIGLAGFGFLIVVLHLIARALGSHQPFVTSFRVALYMMGSLGPLGFVPWVGPHLASIYCLVLLAISLYAMHDLSIPRAGCALFAAIAVVMIVTGVVTIVGIVLGFIPEFG